MALGAVDTLYLDTTVLNEHRGLSLSWFILSIWKPPSLARQGLNRLLFEQYQYINAQHSSHNAVTQLNINSNNFKTWLETWRILTFHIPCVFISADKQKQSSWLLLCKVHSVHTGGLRGAHNHIEFMSSKSWTVSWTHLILYINVHIKSNNKPVINIHLCQLFFLRKVWTCFQRKPEHFLQKHGQREDVEFGSRLAFYCEQELMWNCPFASLLRPLCTAVCGKLQDRSAAGLFQLVSCANVSGCGRVFLVLSCSMRCRSHTGSRFLWGN